MASMQQHSRSAEAELTVRNAEFCNPSEHLAASDHCDAFEAKERCNNIDIPNIATLRDPGPSYDVKVVNAECCPEFDKGDEALQLVTVTSDATTITGDHAGSLVAVQLSEMKQQNLEQGIAAVGNQGEDVLREGCTNSRHPSTPDPKAVLDEISADQTMPVVLDQSLEKQHHCHEVQDGEKPAELSSRQPTTRQIACAARTILSLSQAEKLSHDRQDPSMNAAPAKKPRRTTESGVLPPKTPAKAKELNSLAALLAGVVKYDAASPAAAGSAQKASAAGARKRATSDTHDSSHGASSQVTSGDGRSHLKTSRKRAAKALDSEEGAAVLMSARYSWQSKPPAADPRAPGRTRKDLEAELHGRSAEVSGRAPPHQSEVSHGAPARLRHRSTTEAAVSDGCPEQGKPTHCASERHGAQAGPSSTTANYHILGQHLVHYVNAQARKAGHKNARKHLRVQTECQSLHGHGRDKAGGNVVGPSEPTACKESEEFNGASVPLSTHMQMNDDLGDNAATKGDKSSRTDKYKQFSDLRGVLVYSKEMFHKCSQVVTGLKDDLADKEGQIEDLQAEVDGLRSIVRLAQDMFSIIDKCDSTNYRGQFDTTVAKYLGR